MNDLGEYLEGGDLRSIGSVEKLVLLIKGQDDFDTLFRFLYSDDRLIVMRAADAVEKITVKHPEFLCSHKKEIIGFLEKAKDKEFKWHLALVVSRGDLDEDELENVWNTLSTWAKDKRESKIVRVNSLQSLFDLAKNDLVLKNFFKSIIQGIKSENVPSLSARIRQFEKTGLY